MLPEKARLTIIIRKNVITSKRSKVRSNQSEMKRKRTLRSNQRNNKAKQNERDREGE